ncbi:MAG: helix-turn-helix transcriptional regulator [Clostridia bacterium]|nr:helix-turn-helix transcriptional regulator [Clostridia bacterium]
MKTIGQNIAYYRKEKGITQEQLSEICGVSPQAVSKWENDISCPDITLLKPLARVFGVSVDKLLDDGAEPATTLSENEKETGKVLKIRVLDGKDTVNLNLPVALIEMLLKCGTLSDSLSFNGKKNIFSSIDFNKMLELVSLGVFGKILEVDSEDGEHVEIYIE